MRGHIRGPEGEGREGQDGLHGIAPRDERDDPLPDETALDGADLRHHRRRARPGGRRRPVRPAADVWSSAGPRFQTLAFWGSLALLVVGVGMVGYSYIQWWVEDYAVTNQKVMKVAGLLQQADQRRRPREDQRRRSWSRARWAGCSATGRSRWLPPPTAPDLIYETMRKPAEFRRAMLDQKMEFEQADARHIADAVRAAAPAPVVAAPPPARRGHDARTRRAGAAVGRRQSCAALPSSATTGSSRPRSSRPRRRSCSPSCSP